MAVYLRSALILLVFLAFECIPCYEVFAACPVPSAVQNGKITAGEKNTYDPGDAITYSCNIGFTLTSCSPTRVCLSTGTWSGTAPTCMGVNICGTADCVKSAAEMINAMDTSVEPYNDFFEYACGAWNKKNVIPDHMPGINRFFQLIGDVETKLKDLLEAPRSEKESNATVKVKKLYNSCVNEALLEARGDKPLRELIASLGGWPMADNTWDDTNFDVLNLITDSQKYYGILIDTEVSADDRNSSANIIQIDQPHLGMPGRDYYLKGRNDQKLMAYQHFARDVAVALGASEENASKDAEAIVDLEILLANITVPKEERHDLEAMYNRMTVAEMYTNITDKVMYGTVSETAQWRYCVGYVNNNVGLAVGRMFAEKHFDKMAKADMHDMIKNLRKSFNSLLNSATWLDTETRRLARDKAQIKEENVLVLLSGSYQNDLNKLRLPINTSLWMYNPAVVNAYYAFSKNQILFPAAVLQPPFYGKSRLKALNYGSIGSGIGHEITHGFDDKGRQFNKYGNLVQWWSDRVIAGFKQKAQCIIDQYSNYTVKEINMKINGINTQGENIADNGGIKQSFKAYRQWVTDQVQEEQRLPGIQHLTPNQLFFLSFAQTWCGTMRPQSLLAQLRTTVYSTMKFRVIGTLSNSEDFADAFKCPAASPMNPVKKCSVW